MSVGSALVQVHTFIHALGHEIATYEYTAPFAALLKRALSPLWVVLANPIVAFPIYTLMLIGMGIFHEANAWVGATMIFGLLQLLFSLFKEGWIALLFPPFYSFILGLMTGPSWEEIQEMYEDLAEEAQKAKEMAYQAKDDAKQLTQIPQG